MVYRNRIDRFEGARTVIREELQKLGKMEAGELRVLLVFLLVAALWMGRGLINTGLESMGAGAKLSDTAIAIAGGILLFVVPANKDTKSLLSWDDTRNLPWGILLLFGGGLALAAAFKTSGLIDVVATGFQALASLDQIWIILILTTVALFLTDHEQPAQVFVPVVAWSP